MVASAAPTPQRWLPARPERLALRSLLLPPLPPLRRSLDGFRNRPPHRLEALVRAKLHLDDIGVGLGEEQQADGDGVAGAEPCRQRAARTGGEVPDECRRREVGVGGVQRPHRRLGSVEGGGAGVGHLDRDVVGLLGQRLGGQREAGEVALHRPLDHVGDRGLDGADPVAAGLEDDRRGLSERKLGARVGEFDAVGNGDLGCARRRTCRGLAGLVVRAGAQGQRGDGEPSSKDSAHAHIVRAPAGQTPTRRADR